MRAVRKSAQVWCTAHICSSSMHWYMFG